ncbi:MAG: hydrogenase maturation protease [Cyanobacteria bacterium J06635_1]
MATTASPHSMHRFVVIGYGNPQRGDDAIGQKVVSQLKTLSNPNLDTYSVRHLTPELSSKLAVADVAIFVDACKLANTDTVRIKSLEACGSETGGSAVPASGHSCDPCSLLALTHSAYGHWPKAWWVEVPASDFTAEHQLSDVAERGITQALQAISDLINEALIDQATPAQSP